MLPSLVDCWVNIGETSNVVYNKNTALEVWLSETEKLYAKNVGFSEIASEFLLEPTSAAWGMSGISFEKL